MNILLELKQSIIRKPILSAVLIDYDTSSALLVGDVTSLHVSLVSFTAVQCNVKKCPQILHRA